MKPAPAPVSILHASAWLVLALLLLMLGFRLTASETVRETISQKMAEIIRQESPQTENEQAIPIVGPTFTAAYAAIACLLAGVMTLCAARLGILTRFRLAQLALIATLAVLALVSAFHADYRFGALVGSADLLASLAAAWTVALACHERLLGSRARHVVLAAVLAILTLGVARALMQQFIEFPETLEMVKKDPNKALRENGINPDDPVQKKLFMARLASSEVFGYGGLSNVFATQMIADVALLAAICLAGLVFLKPAAPQPPPSSKRRTTVKPAPAAGEIPIHVVALVGLGIMLVVGMVVLPLTDSKGGLASAIIAIALVLLGGVFWKRVVQYRRVLLLSAGTLAILLPALLIGYGITHHGLPSRSLLFRWQYWTATVPIIRDHPLWGVGLNNFGDFYPQFKSPASPEDVRDPHSFFVRYAAEIGIPGLIAVGVLLVWMIWAALPCPTAPVATIDPTPDSPVTLPPALLVNAGVIALAWVPLHFLAEPANEYTIIVALLLAVLAWAVFAAAMIVLSLLTPRGARYLALCALAAALAMFLYDQINMALVTGPVAMLFWMLLAAADVRSGPSASKPASRVLAPALALAFAGVALAVTGFLWIPLSQGDGPDDPDPYEVTYIQEYLHGRYDAAQNALNMAIARSPHSIELLLKRIDLRRHFLHQPVAADIRRVFQLDCSNAGIRFLLAVPDTDLPPAERRQALLDALAFDPQLEPQEPKRLTPLQLAQTRGALARLPAYTWFYHASHPAPNPNPG